MESFYNSHWVLTFLIFFPMIGALAVALADVRSSRTVAFAVGLIEFLVALPLFWTFNPAATTTTADNAIVPFQNWAALPWMESWGIFYRIGLDGISLFMVLLTAFLLPLMVLGSWTYIQQRLKLYYAMLLALTGGVIGVFVALDMFLFYVFWEIVLIPMYFLIGIWGGKERIYAAVKFFLYTAFGSLLMLVAILYLYFRFQALTPPGTPPTFAYLDLLQLPLTFTEQVWLSRSRCRSFRSTPGCRRRTCRRLPPAPWSWPVCC
jgi:NADH-quinone oxidoreductase subunit M